MVELKVAAVAFDWRGSPVIKLQETKGQRAVFIWVGILEATSIGMQLEGQRAARPMTHDLMMLVLEELGAEIDSIVITDMKDTTYYAELQLQFAERTTAIDCRPSDAIALALRAEAPIYIEDELLARLDAARQDSEVELSTGTTFVDSGETTVH